MKRLTFILVTWLCLVINVEIHACDCPFKPEFAEAIKVHHLSFLEPFYLSKIFKYKYQIVLGQFYQVLRTQTKGDFLC